MAGLLSRDRQRPFLALLCAILITTSSSRAQYLENLPINHPAIQYLQGSLNDPAARLNRLLESGKIKLEFREGGLGYLPSVLEHLGVNPDSQALVFSKTSFQAARISPHNPRAIYFNDDVAVGWVRGGDGLEVAALDPRQGVNFYTLNTSKTGQPGLARRDVCLHCHQGPATAGVPGIFVGSVFPDSSGMPQRLGAIITDHRTLFADRWGGWFVTATRGEQRDRANAFASDPELPDVLQTDGRQNLSSLAREFDTKGYLTPLSDIVGLMTFEHQTQMTNLITRSGWEARIAQHDAQSGATLEALVTYMLFADEVPLPEPIQGVSTFTQTFPQRGPRDRQGRSLRDFDLHTRLFRYPLSYMVYSAAFNALPSVVRERVYQRLYDVLTGGDQSKKFTNLSKEDRRSIFEILRDTKPDLPGYWAAFTR
ncbi:MAG: hypothetical protein ACR2NN_12845 [Bryobacteraceae bacterium]